MQVLPAAGRAGRLAPVMATLKKRDFVIEVPVAPALLSPIVMVVPLQLLAYNIAVRRGCAAVAAATCTCTSWS